MWQPIETAPTDGTWLLLFCPAGIGDGWESRDYDVKGAPNVTLGSCEAGSAQSKQWLSVESYTEVHDYGGMTGVSTETHRLGITPTHWQPLPELPAA